MQIRKWVFWPVFLLVLCSVLFSLFFPVTFVEQMQAANFAILHHFDWLFNAVTALILLVLLLIRCSWLSNLRIGGEQAKPLFSKWRYFAITLCTTVAAGLLFWSTAEPLYHLHDPPPFALAEPGSAAAEVFAMGTLFLHWTITPYGIYTLISILFALVFYNLERPFRISALLYPLIRRSPSIWIDNLIDIVCLFALIAGMAASLGAGILTIAGGLHTIGGWSQSAVMLGLISMAIVATFILSSISGLMKGIRMLSDLNIRIFIVLLGFVLFFGPGIAIWKMGGQGFLHYVLNFVPNAIGHYEPGDKVWTGAWTIFNWANWMAWAPLTGMFLGRISRGYRVKEVIMINLVWPSIFIVFWMIIFGGSTLYYDAQSGGAFQQELLQQGPQSVVYSLFEQLPFSGVVSVVFLFIVFISFVTAADSNTTVMSGLSTKGISHENQESPAGMKLIWGAFIGILAWIMITYSGIEGVKILSTIGGFPVLFLFLLLIISALKLLVSGRTLFDKREA